ncbi:hypothetical protein CH63R_11721 [Colletotrichum higginsianum IMI 349063]|uniref:Uncharacterized protein n=1 Tax=Colletotrichum higginsianum (strain IMI 349063) TaxID=759273 RepID=A0A1B7XZ10_COLHI|nr:hypothetical protein CH63R_11721 [Colletotrichum higginsianum IMI 349063]OBR05018.1 hypothetical protein CH63R_11721 [Colletotrichum higginsianum IMI 349063]
MEPLPSQPRPMDQANIVPVPGQSSYILRSVVRYNIADRAIIETCCCVWRLRWWLVSGNVGTVANETAVSEETLPLLDMGGRCQTPGRNRPGLDSTITEKGQLYAVMYTRRLASVSRRAAGGLKCKTTGSGQIDHALIEELSLSRGAITISSSGFRCCLDATVELRRPCTCAMPLSLGQILHSKLAVVIGSFVICVRSDNIPICQIVSNRGTYVNLIHVETATRCDHDDRCNRTKKANSLTGNHCQSPGTRPSQGWGGRVFARAEECQEGVHDAETHVISSVRDKDKQARA